MSQGDCNVCLAKNRKLINIVNTHLQQTYENLANYKVRPEQCLWVCCVCRIRLQQCHQLRRLARQTCCYLMMGTIPEANNKAELSSLGLVQLSCSPTAHIHVADSTLHNILVKQEPIIELEDIGLKRYEDVLANRGHWYLDDVKQTDKETFNYNYNNSCYEDLKNMTGLKNEVEIEIKLQRCDSFNITQDLQPNIKLDEELKVESTVLDSIDNGSKGNDGKAAKAAVSVYSCHICKHNFSTVGLLRKHAASHGRSAARGKVECPVCGKYYSCAQVLLRHRRIHSGVKAFACPVCGKRFSRRDHYNKHARTHAARVAGAARGATPAPEVRGEVKSGRGPPEECDPSRSAGAKSADAEIEITSGGRPETKMRMYSCDLCGRSYRSRQSLKAHAAAEHAGAQFVCDHCSKTFARRGNLRLHLRTHTGERRFCCDACGKTFSHKSALNTHTRVHSGVKPYACEQCGRRFTASGQLAEHRLVHSGARPFACGVCGLGFKRARHMKKHMATHTGEKPYCCDVCLKRFSRSDNFAIHRRIHTGEKPFSCDVCQLSFSENRHLKKHKSVHDGAAGE